MKRAAIFVLAMLFLCSCAGAPKTGRVGEEELKALRAQHPYNDKVFPVVDYAWDQLDDPNKLLSLPEGIKKKDYAFAVIEFTSDPYYIAYAPFSNEEDLPEEFQDMNATNKFKSLSDFRVQYPQLDAKTAKVLVDNAIPFIDAKVHTILYGGGKLRKGEAFKINFAGFQRMIQPGFVDVFGTGDRAVCLISRSTFEEPHLKKTYGISRYTSWHLTEEDVVLSVSSNYGADYFSGLYLESFKQEVLNILNKE